MKRLFRGLRRTGPRARYDAVVIGSGIGGLVCGNLLAREGLSVLLVEQHYMAGGYCSTFRRGGYTFDAATHFYPLLGNPKTHTGRLLESIGVRTGWVRMDPVDTFHFPDGSRFEVPADLETYRRRLDEEFPHQRQAIESFFRDVRRAYARGLSVYFRGRDEGLLGEFAEVTLTEALDRHIDDRKLKLLLTADCPHWGSPPERTSFVFDSMLRLSYFLGNYYPVGGSQAFADELARCFEAHGGHILMSTAARRIESRAGRVQAVDLETLRGPLRGRHRVETELVVSNADLEHTYRDLLSDEVLATDAAVPAADRAALAGHRPSFPCFLVHLGLRGMDDRDLERAQGYYWRHWDPDRVGRDGLICKIFVPTLYDPSLAPEGGQIVILQKVQELDFEAIDDWPRHKEAVAAEMLAQMAAALPGVEERIVVQTAASAETSRRFTRNVRGAMLGWEMSPDQLGAARPGFEGPLRGLYRVGHWVQPGGGVTPVIVSAQRVAERILTGVTPPVLESP